MNMTTKEIRVARALRATWIKALRSGKYAQTKHVLHRILKYPDHDSHSYCCLGVICESLDWPSEIRNDALDWKAFYETEGTFRCATTLPKELWQRLGLLDEFGSEIVWENGEIIGTRVDPASPELPASLVGLNDVGKSFKYIAYRMERYPHLYFTYEAPKRKTR